MSPQTWISPDGQIEKEILILGEFGLKPTENSLCTINIRDCKIDADKYNNDPIVIGNVGSYFGRLLDTCLQNMHCGEVAKVCFKMKQEPFEQFTLELKSFASRGFIWEWNAKEKFDLALQHKAEGVELYKKNDYIISSLRFGKALKLLASIPIDVSKHTTEVDGLVVENINALKSTLYSNLASCFLKDNNSEGVITLCQKALLTNPNNVKAMYRCGVAYNEQHAYEQAMNCFKSILKLEPENRAALEMIKLSDFNLTAANARVNDIFKKMFSS